MRLEEYGLWTCLYLDRDGAPESSIWVQGNQEVLVGQPGPDGRIVLFSALLRHTDFVSSAGDAPTNELFKIAFNSVAGKTAIAHALTKKLRAFVTNGIATSMSGVFRRVV